MSLQTWSETLVSAQVDGPVLASFTTAVTMIPAAARVTLPASGFWAIGKVLRAKGAGRISNVVTAQPTFTFDFRLGSVATPIIVFNGGVMTCSTTVHTSVPFEFEFTMTCRAVGSGTSANLMGQGKVWSQAFVASGATADSANTHTMLMVPNTAPAVGTGFDSTISNVCDMFAACGTSNAGNGLTLHQYTLESLN